jgi:hypothetical protein
VGLSPLILILIVISVLILVRSAHQTPLCRTGQGLRCRRGRRAPLVRRARDTRRKRGFTYQKAALWAASWYMAEIGIAGLIPEPSPRVERARLWVS